LYIGDSNYLVWNAVDNHIFPVTLLFLVTLCDRWRSLPWFPYFLFFKCLNVLEELAMEASCLSYSI